MSDYSRLKKITFILEKATLGLGKFPTSTGDLDRLVTNEETEPLLDTSTYDDTTSAGATSLEDANKFFITVLDAELEKIKAFYSKKETKLYEDLHNLTVEIQNVERQEESYLHSLWSPQAGMQLQPQTDQRDKTTPVSTKAGTPGSALDQWDDPRSSNTGVSPLPRPGFLPYLIWSSGSLKQQRHIYMKKATALFVLLSELDNYIELNKTGFAKVIKKYEKVVGGQLKSTYLSKVAAEYPFLDSTKEVLKAAIDRLVQWYARIATDGKIGMAETELKANLREYVVWERNTIWRDMIEHERRHETIGFLSNGPGEIPVEQFTKLSIAGIPCTVPRVIPTRVFTIFFALITLVGLCNSNFFPTAEQNNCFAILIFASMLWAFEAFPLFVTSMIIPVLIVVLRVMTDGNGTRLDSKSAAKRIFSDMFGPVIMLLLGGFSLAAALSKHNIAKSMASVILEKAGTKPHSVLLANMFVSTFASMWISNVAAPVLCFSLISPILRNLPHRSPYARSLVIGIAMAANVGGMASPIASPQNVISMGIMNPPPSWLEWFTIAIPICIALDLCIWALLLLIYRPKESNIAPELQITRSNEISFDGKQLYIIAVTMLTIFLWCVEGSIESTVGDMGIIAILPMFAFFGFGILTKDDWNSMLWSVVMLAMGGIALGKAVDSSGLLKVIAGQLTPMLQELSPFYCTVILSGIVVVVTSFISHTVGALIILPVVAKIGELLPDPRPRTLVMAAALMCSGGMSLPVSSFPNMNAISLEDSRGIPWLQVSDFLTVGVVSSAFAWFFAISIGYTIMTLLEFH